MSRWAEVDWRQADEDIAAQVGVSRQAVNKKRHALKLQHLAPAARHRRALEARVKQARQAGLSAADIAERLGYSAQYVRELLRGMDLGGPAVFHPSKWTTDWLAVDWGKANKELAAEIGVHPTTISYWRRKLTRLGLIGEGVES